MIKRCDLQKEEEEERLLEWFKERKALKITIIESASNIPKDTLRHFIKRKRPIPLKHFNNAVNELEKYGYQKYNDNE